ncbi:e4e188f7-23d0-4f1e-ab61-e736b64ded42 [Sclerotinia trifoliorum]|uniref:Glutathione S-transferase kappa n=1 Tax=Sclerotinia trifoliorum TaxID=28548 RepID=A0A8H2W511_9HELO|nr:e4e188f7-23d0-4f1e-ab61-e736b64ded42 [Sclerotinia trifoliorum]
MPGHIDCYLDCSSFYSYAALVHLRKNREVLLTHDVTVDLIPVFLGGINHGSGNKPPWTLPAKAKYSKFDTARTILYHGLPELQPPDFFPPVTLLPQRALCFIKSRYPVETFEKTFLSMFDALWVAPHRNITIPEELRDFLSKLGSFDEKQVGEIMAMAAEKEWKDKLLANTKDALEKGAFGAPWLWVRNGEGLEEPFFGSDRFHFIWRFLGVGFRDVEIVEGDKGEERKKAKL